MKEFIMSCLLLVAGLISLWFDYHPRIEALWSVKDIFLTYPPQN